LNRSYLPSARFPKHKTHQQFAFNSSSCGKAGGWQLDLNSRLNTVSPVIIFL
jgi:hypothetical protein